MSVGTHAMVRSQNDAVRRWPCDGVARFNTGNGRTLTYSEAWQEVFLDSGGSIRTALDGKETNIHTRESLRRLRKLNEAYAGQIKRFQKDWEDQRISSMIAYAGDCPACGGKIGAGKVLFCEPCFAIIPEPDRNELRVLYVQRRQGLLDLKVAAVAKELKTKITQ